MAQSVDEYRGTKVVIRFDGHKCIHSRQCVLGLPEVFVANADGPWIRPDGAPPETVAALALTARRARSPSNGSMAIEMSHRRRSMSSACVKTVRSRFTPTS